VPVIARLLINAAALWVATRLVPGISYTGDWPLLFVVALIFGVLNVVVRPLLILLSLPAVIITLGLFLLVLNAGMIALVAWLTPGFRIDGFWTAFLAALVVGVVSWVGSSVIGSTGKIEIFKARRG
jgi:putative membrane protein